MWTMPLLLDIAGSFIKYFGEVRDIIWTIRNQVYGLIQ